MQPTIDASNRRSCPFGAELSLDDLLLMARVELKQARERLLASVELLDQSGPFGEARFSQPLRPEDELAFAPTSVRLSPP
jgi:hypothetical protein